MAVYRNSKWRRAEPEVEIANDGTVIPTAIPIFYHARLHYVIANIV
jgi:hypothetical protein